MEINFNVKSGQSPVDFSFGWPDAPIYIFPAEHSWLEVASWIAQIALAILAVIAAFFAYRQLKEMSDYRESRLRIANATLIS
jgi:hypothetical protein